MTNQSILEIPLQTIDGNSITLAKFQAKAFLIVNVASRCGFTPQYQGLQELHDHFKTEGLAVLGFPCNQFGGQEPGTEAEIKSFCETKYHVTFPLFTKIEVNGANTHPLYEYLKSNAPGVLGTEAIKWNFTKFLVDKEGGVIGRFGPQVVPGALVEEIEECLSK